MTTYRHSVQPFRDLRDSKDDERWAARAVMKLAGSGLDAAVAQRRLSDALAELRSTGLSAEEMFGPADDWSRQVVEQESLAGTGFREENLLVRGALVVGLALGTLLATISGVMDAVQHGWRTEWSLGFVLLPVISGVGFGLMLWLRERLLERFPAMVANVLAFLAGAVVVVIPAVLFGVGLGEGPTAWWLVEVAVLAGATHLASRRPHDAPGRLVGTMPDHRWTVQAAALLRERGDLSEEQVQQRITEAREHARDAGSSLASEFGNPHAFVGSLPVNRRVTTLRSALFWTALCLLDGLLVLPGRDPDVWLRVALGALLVTTVGQWVVHLRTLRAR